MLRTMPDANVVHLPICPPEAVRHASGAARERLRPTVAAMANHLAKDLAPLLAGTAVDFLDGHIALSEKQKQAHRARLERRMRTLAERWLAQVTRSAASRPGRPRHLSVEREQRLYEAALPILELIRESPEGVATTLFEKRLSSLLGWAVRLPDPDETVDAATRPGIAPTYRLRALLSVLSGDADDTVTKKLKRYRPGKTPSEN